MGIQGSRALFTLLVLTLVAAPGCVDETIILRDPDLYGELPAAAGGFIGYTDAGAQLTVCGNCHVEKQGDWLATKHAGAWSGLQESGHASEACEGCHTTGELGNAAVEVAGHNATRDPRYQDVQCEACHGAGLVREPTTAWHTAVRGWRVRRQYPLSLSHTHTHVCVCVGGGGALPAHGMHVCRYMPRNTRPY